MDPYAPTEVGIDPSHGNLPMVRYASYTLWFLGVLYAFVSLSISPFYAMIPMVEDGDSDAAMVMGAIGLCVGGFIFCLSTVPMIFAAIQLRRGSKVAWFATVAIGAFFCTSACMPFGAFLLYAMLNEEVRRAFLD